MIDYHIRWKKEAELESQRPQWGAMFSERDFWTNLDQFGQACASLNNIKQV